MAMSGNRIGSGGCDALLAGYSNDRSIYHILHCRYYVRYFVASYKLREIFKQLKISLVKVVIVLT